MEQGNKNTPPGLIRSTAWLYGIFREGDDIPVMHNPLTTPAWGPHEVLAMILTPGGQEGYCDGQEDAIRAAIASCPGGEIRIALARTAPGKPKVVYYPIPRSVTLTGCKDLREQFSQHLLLVTNEAADEDRDAWGHGPESGRFTDEDREAVPPAPLHPADKALLEARIRGEDREAVPPAHTPGPWKVYGRGLNMDKLAGHQHGCIFADDGSHDGDGRNICDIAASKRIVHEDKRRHDGFAHSQEDEANAHLIAAAPELLAALRGVVDNGEFNQQLLDEARAAIAKAEGGAS